jgi:hypothetical protein
VLGGLALLRPIQRIVVLHRRLARDVSTLARLTGGVVVRGFSAVIATEFPRFRHLAVACIVSTSCVRMSHSVLLLMRYAHTGRSDR